jgi:hypothetical protein
MAKQYGIRHKKDGRWYVGFSADRAQRLIWSRNEREAWRGDMENATAQAALMARHRKPVALEPSPLATI